MKRRALIIINPGDFGEENYCNGVFIDSHNYELFLKSSCGGCWRDDEILIFDRVEAEVIRRAVGDLELVDYSFIAFCGHGGHRSANEPVTVEIKPGVSMSSDDLRRGAKRHTLVLDCCRKIEEPTPLLEASFESYAGNLRNIISSDKCRRLYEGRIKECGEGIIVVHGCAVNELAGDSEELGGFYSYGLINAAMKWVSANLVSIKNGHNILSVPEAHDKAFIIVDKLSGGRQHPQISKPRSKIHFPFAIIA